MRYNPTWDDYPLLESQGGFTMPLSDEQEEASSGLTVRKRIYDHSGKLLSDQTHTTTQLSFAVVELLFAVGTAEVRLVQQTGEVIRYTKP